jgi:hypothetical protein
LVESSECVVTRERLPDDEHPGQSGDGSEHRQPGHEGARGGIDLGAAFTLNLDLEGPEFLAPRRRRELALQPLQLSQECRNAGRASLESDLDPRTDARVRVCRREAGTAQEGEEALCAGQSHGADDPDFDLGTVGGAEADVEGVELLGGQEMERESGADRPAQFGADLVHERLADDDLVFGLGVRKPALDRDRPEQAGGRRWTGHDSDVPRGVTGSDRGDTGLRDPGLLDTGERERLLECRLPGRNKHRHVTGRRLGFQSVVGRAATARERDGGCDGGPGDASDEAEPDQGRPAPPDDRPGDQSHGAVRLPRGGVAY